MTARTIDLYANDATTRQQLADLLRGVGLPEDAVQDDPFFAYAAVADARGDRTPVLGCTIEDESVVTARFEDGSCVLTGREPGTTTITIDADGGPHVAEVRVTPPPLSALQHLAIKAAAAFTWVAVASAATKAGERT